MLLQLFVTFHVLYSASCTITCHNCPIDKNNLPYLVTAYNVPANLSDCSIVDIGDTCLVDIIWSRDPDKTQVGLSSRGDERMYTDEHALFTNINLEKKAIGYVWSKSVSYTCSTDNCNSPSVLQRILASLELTDNFDDVKDLLRKDEPFDGNWCRRETNNTAVECNTDMVPSSCQECSFQGTNTAGSVEYCSNCLTTDIGEIFMAHEIDFNITDRTRADHWILVCRFPDCNTNTYGSKVRDSVKSHFDFAKFLGETSLGSRAIVSPLVLLLSIVVSVKRLF